MAAQLRSILPKIVPPLIVTAALVALWWLFNGDFFRPNTQLPACPRPLELRLAGERAGHLVACTADEFSELFSRLDFPVPRSADFDAVRFFDQAGAPCRVTLDPQGRIQLVEQGRLSGEVALALALPIDLNLATADDLQAISGLGEKTAAAIVGHREANGPFCSIGDLTRVKGIGPRFIEEHATQLSATCKSGVAP